MCSYINHLFLFLFFNGHQTTAKQFPYDKIISFGDSNTDTGNVYNLTSHTWPRVPPYFQGRFSNGPVWIETLGISNIKNYAYGGATTDNDLIQGYTASDTIAVPGFRQQIQIYLTETNMIHTDFVHTLYAIFGGGNNYYFNKTMSPSIVASSILDAVKDLLKIGVKHILILNQPPSQAMPFVQTLEDVNYYKERTIYYNNNLSVGINKLDYDHKTVSIHLFDTYSFLLNLIANNNNSSLNIKDHCWNISNGNVIILCSKPESYVYIDQYHFSARAHALIGDGVRQFLIKSCGAFKSSYALGTIVYVQFLLLSSSYAYEKLFV